MTRRRLVVIGDVVTDVVVRHALPIAAGTDTAASIRLRGGGAGANVACWAAGRGLDVTFVGCVGAQDAEERAAELRRAGVEPVLAIDAARPTGSIVVLVDARGERTMLTDRGAGAHLPAAAVPAGLIAGGDHLHVSGYALFSAGGLDAALAALRAARDAGVPVSVDPASASFLQAAGATRFLDWTAGAALCFPNLDEAAVLTGRRDAPAAARILAERYGAAVVTGGADGAVLARGATVLRQPAVQAAAVVDSTGAGDAFVAGFVATLLGGGTDAACLAAGAALAAVAVGLVGGRPA